jgi:hypothetical protein
MDKPKKVSRHRAYELFDPNLPFRHKVEQSKVTYTRKKKHKKDLHD